MNDITVQVVRQINGLLSWRSVELEELFSTLSVINVPQGCLRGTLFCVQGTGWLPRGLASGLYWLLDTPVNPWRGKTFEGDVGCNQWGSLPGGRFGRYAISRRTGADGGDSIWLDYNLAGNPRLLRNIRGEARQLQEGLWLARMLWVTEGNIGTLLWFTLNDNHHGR